MKLVAQNVRFQRSTSRRPTFKESSLPAVKLGWPFKMHKYFNARTLYTDSPVGSTDAVARHESFARIICPLKQDHSCRDNISPPRTVAVVWCWPPLGFSSAYCWRRVDAWSMPWRDCPMPGTWAWATTWSPATPTTTWTTPGSRSACCSSPGPTTWRRPTDATTCQTTSKPCRRARADSRASRPQSSVHAVTSKHYLSTSASKVKFTYIDVRWGQNPETEDEVKAKTMKPRSRPKPLFRAQAKVKNFLKSFMMLTSLTMPKHHDRG